MSAVIVEADSVADYLSRYYKQERLRDVDSAYGEGTLLAFYEIDLECFGYVCTSHHDNITGRFIAWPKYTPEEVSEESRTRWLEMRAALQGGLASSNGRKGGQAQTDRKAAAARKNGKLGGRPKSS